MKYYNYEDLGIVSPKKPHNIHLWWEVSSSLWFMVDSTNQLVLLKSINKGYSWSIVTTRSHKIQSGWNDGTYIWLVDCDNDGTADDFDVWKITVDGNDTITSIGSRTGTNPQPDANTVYAFDIFKIGTDVFVINHENRGGPDFLFILWDVDTAPFTEKDNLVAPASGSITDVGYGVVNGSMYYVGFSVSIGLDLYIIIYNNSTTTLSFSSKLDDHTLSEDNRSLHGIAFDGTDTLYLTNEQLKLITYSISGDSWTVKGDYVLFMLDRNTASGVMEKGFHLTEYKVYQLHPHVLHQLYFIAKIPATTAIIAITDNFLMCDDVGTNEFPVYEYVDVSNYTTRVEFAHEIMNYSEGTLGVNRPVINLEKGMFMQIIGTLTSDELDRLYKGTYNFGEQDVGDTDTTITLFDSATGTDSGKEASVIASEDGHKKVVKIIANGDNGTNAIWTHSGLSESGILDIELWVKYIDKGVGTHWIKIYNESTQVIAYVLLYSNDNKIYIYYGNGAGGTTNTNRSLATDTWVHIRWELNLTADTQSVWLDGVEKVTDQPFASDRVATTISKVEWSNDTAGGANSFEWYIDAIGESWDANYDVGDNLSVEAGETDQVIFEGIVIDFDGERLQKVWLESPAKKELLEKKPRGSFSGRSDEIMTTLLSTYCKYVTKGTFSVGTAMGTVKYAGDKSLMTILIELALFEKWIWKLRPQGQLDFNDGTTDTLVDLSSSDKVWMVKTGEVREPYNYFYLKGALVSGVQLYKELEEADDLTSQQLHGYNPYEKTFASFNSQSILNALTTNVKARLKETPLVVEHWHYDASLGMLAIGETVTFVYNTNNVNVSSDQFLNNRVLFKGKENAGGYTIADKLI